MYKIEKKQIRDINGKTLERQLIFHETENDLNFQKNGKYSLANCYLGLYKGGNRSMSNPQYQYVLDIAAFCDYLEKKGIDVENYFNEIKIDDANEYMMDYCNTLLSNMDYPGQEARNRKRRSIARFLINIRDEGKNPYLKGHYIYRSEAKEHGSKRKSVESELLIIKIGDQNILRVERECPDFFVDCFLSFAKKHKPNCWIAAIFCYLAGLRPSEACNLRHPNSEYGSNIRCVFDKGRLIGFRIDLTKPSWQRPLRGDNVSVGNIKRLRKVLVLPDHMDELNEDYEDYLLFTTDFKRETYGPLIVQKRRSGREKSHMAYRYRNFVDDFHYICERYVFPELIERGGKYEAFAKGLEDKKYGPHMFRFAFTGRIVEAGEPWPVVMAGRGDSPSCPETAVMYTYKSGIIKKAAEIADDDVKNQIYKQLLFSNPL